MYAVALGLISAGATFCIVFKGIPWWIERQAYQAVDQQIAPFSVETLAGTTVRSTEWKGRVVVISFWATWCLPCHAELPEIEKVQEILGSRARRLGFALPSQRSRSPPAQV